MKKHILTLLFFCITLFWGACKKKDYSGNSPAPNYTFQFQGTINGNPLSLQAGVNNNYLFAWYNLDGNGVYNFTGELRDRNCTSNCSNALKIIVNDYRPFSTLPTTIDSSLTPAYYSYATPAGTPSAYVMNFTSTLNNGTPQSWLWNFGDGGTASIASPTHKYMHPGIYPTTLSVTSTTSCFSSITNSLIAGEVGNAFESQFSVSTAGNTVTFIPGSDGVAPYTYSWNFGDATTSAASNPVHTYTNTGVFQVSLTKTDATGYSDTYYMHVTINPTTVCQADMYMTGISGIANPMNLACAVIEWRDANDTLWTSQNNNQTATKCFFRILSVENYLNNSNGQPTKKVHIQISCTLYNGSSSVPFAGDAVFALGYP
jgi:PKD repeat protein